MSDEATKAVEEMNGKPLESAVITPPENMTNMTEQPESGVDPYKYDEKVVARLVEAFNNSYNVTEACQYAQISRETYYRWLKEIPEFEPIIEEAKAMPLRKAKETITSAIVQGDVNTAKWYVERRDPDFKPKAEVDNTHELKETRRKLGDVLDERSADDFGEQPSTTAGETSGAEVPQNPTDIS